MGLALYGHIEIGFVYDFCRILRAQIAQRALIVHLHFSRVSRVSRLKKWLIEFRI